MLRKLLLAAFLLFPFCLLAQGRDLPDFSDLVDKQGAAVVNISTTQTVRGQTAPPGSEEDPFYDFFRRFGPPQPPRDYETRSLGSGFIISQEGYILTNSHVVEAADDITVRLTDKREYKAKVIGSDKRSDVAVLKSNLTDTDKFDAQLKSLGSDIVALKKQGNPSAAIERLEQEVIILKSQQDNRSAATSGGTNTAEFDAFRSQVTRTINSLQAQIQNLQQQLRARGQ